MHFSLDDRVLIRGLVAAVVLAGASACSRSDRAPAGDQTSQTGAVTNAADTQAVTTAQPPRDDTVAATGDTHMVSKRTTPKPQTSATHDTSAKSSQEVSGYRPMDRDTSGAPSTASTDTASPETTSPAAAGNRSDTVTVGDSAHVGKPGERIEPNQTSEDANADSMANQPDSERVRPPEDSSETVGAVTTDSAAGDTMPRDTTGDLGQVDTSSQQADTLAQTSTDTAAIQAQVDTSTQQQDTLAEASPDTAAVQAQLDTTTTQAEADIAAENQPDTVAVVGDSAQIGKTGERLEPNAATAEANADTLASETERIRPPEDSTEILGNVNTADSATVKTEADANVQSNAGAEANQDVDADADLKAVGDANAEAVGAARVEATGGTVTGAAAVSAITRQGQRCIVVDPEQSPDVRWDVASSPATLNPCGTGTMTLPRVWTGEKE